MLVVNKSDSRCAVVRFCYHSYDYRLNCLYIKSYYHYLEQIAPLPAAQARIYCKGFCGCRAGEMVSTEITEIFNAFGLQLNDEFISQC